MNKETPIPIFPYTRIVGQDEIKRALEVAYIEPHLGGVLISGQRGTGKSTIVRAFAHMVYKSLPVTIPINATEDRVVGGWKIQELVQGKTEWQAGLLEEAHQKLLYIDEVNLLDDHIINIVLDVAASRILVIQRDLMRRECLTQFTLVGTMNPEEGNLRPQLLDRFGLMVQVVTDADAEVRYNILRAVLDFDEVLLQQNQGQISKYLVETQKEAEAYFARLKAARESLHSIDLKEQILRCCAQLADEFSVEGHRAERDMVRAARAHAALQRHSQIECDDIERTAPLVLQHRRLQAKHLNYSLWDKDEQDRLNQIVEESLAK